MTHDLLIPWVFSMTINLQFHLTVNLIFNVSESMTKNDYEIILESALCDQFMYLVSIVLK